MIISILGVVISSRGVICRGLAVTVALGCLAFAVAARVILRGGGDFASPELVILGARRRHGHGGDRGDCLSLKCRDCAENNARGGVHREYPAVFVAGEDNLFDGTSFH